MGGIRLIAAIGLAACAVPAPAAVIEANPTNYRPLLAKLAPGDTLRLAKGTYARGLPLDKKAGTEAAPIVVLGPEDQSAVFTARDCCNTVQLDDTSYVKVLNLTLDGAGLAAPFGVDARGRTHHITLENLRIIRHNGSQQTVGISTKGPAWGWVIRHNTILEAGTGMYLGNSDGTAPFVGGVIEHNLIVDTIGYNIEIKHQVPRSVDAGLPAGASRTLIRHNVFSKRHAAAGADGARPNLLVGHFPLSGAGADDAYDIYGNFFYRNPTEALFQGEGNITLHDNLFVNPDGDAVIIKPHNDVPRAISIFHNTVVARGVGIRVSGGDPRFVQQIVGNISFAGAPLSGANLRDNVTGAYASAAKVLTAPFADPGSLNLYPRRGAAAANAPGMAGDLVAGLADGSKDFNGTIRHGTRAGAYDGEGVNPGWYPALTIKP